MGSAVRPPLQRKYVRMLLELGNGKKGGKGIETYRMRPRKPVALKRGRRYSFAGEVGCVASRYVSRVSGQYSRQK